MAMSKKELIQFMDGLEELTSKRNKLRAVWVIEESRWLTVGRKAGGRNGN